MKRCWLVKSEPDVYSLENLKRDGSTGWTGVRNYQARNTMRDLMKPGDAVLFYYSNSDPKGVAGVATVKGAPKPDPTQFDKKSEYFDPRSTRENPTWMMVELAFERAFKRVIPLEELKKTKGLEKMMLVQRGSRLSVQPVTPDEYAVILKLAE